MKKIISFILILTLITSLSACGASGAQETTPTTQETTAQINPEQLVEKAKKEIDEYAGSIEGYMAALEHLNQLPDDAAENPEVAVFLLETEQQTLALIEEEMDGIYQPDKIQGYMEQLLPITMFPNESLDAGKAREKVDLILNIGNVYLKWEEPEKAMDYWKECQNPTMDVILSAMDLFQQGKNVQAVQHLRENLENSEDYEWFAFSVASTQLSDHIQDELDMWKAYAMISNIELDPQRAWIESVTEYWNGRTYETFDGYTEENLQYLKENAGKEAAGKVLILEKNRAFGAETAGIRISSHFQDLPDELVPASVEEIEYIILTDVDYTEEGTFPVGTVLIKEIATVSVYSVHESEPIYQSPEKQTAIFFNVTMSYNGDPPAFYAPNHPDMSKYAKEALNLIMDNINNQ